jgi:hypothetical protein
MGDAFFNPECSHRDPGVALAALVVARFSHEKDVIWDLTTPSHPALMALPSAALAMGRSYVILGGEIDRLYDMKCDFMSNIEYVLHGFDLIQGWAGGGANLNKLSVRLGCVRLFVQCVTV